MAARAADVPPDWFWASTPCELALEIEAQREITKGKKKTQWISAALMRQRSLPPLETFVNPIVEKPAKQTWQQQQAFMRSLPVPNAGSARRP